MHRILIALAFALAAALPRAQQPAATGEPLDVMSFNIRYGTANDGVNRWPARREQLFGLLRAESPDIIGYQEALGSQLLEVMTAVPGYGLVGVGRDDGRARGEFAAIAYRADRFTVASSGTFWFSETPEVVASKSWGNNITRICTWARLVDRDGRAFWVFNVHLDHESQPSRERSTALLADRLAARAPAGEPAIVTGDFNAGEDNIALSALTASSPGPGFVDAFRVRHPDVREAGTFTGFEFGRTTGPKIDYIFVTPDTEVIAAAIVRASQDGRYPSDHFPVTARLRLSYR